MALKLYRIPKGYTLFGTGTRKSIIYTSEMSYHGLYMRIIVCVFNGFLKSAIQEQWKSAWYEFQIAVEN